VRRPAAVAAIALAAVLLAGCSASDGADATPSASASASAADTSTASAADIDALAAVSVEGDGSAAPTLTFEQPFTITAPVARVALEGDGEPITMSDVVEIRYVVVSGDDGSVLGSTWDDGATPEALPLADPQLTSALKEVIIGQKVGARVLFAVPGTEATDSTEASPAQLLAIEIPAKVARRAQGDAVAPVAGLPTVTLAEDGEPSVEIPAGTEATPSLVAQTLIQGTGPVVESGQVVTFQYSGWLTDGTQFDSSWAKGTPFQTQLGVGSVIDGWDQGLVGQAVGSQVLLVIPAELGYGEDGSGETIPPNATLVFVVDILYAS
jgi:peptidylprolyl isomerase